VLIPYSKYVQILKYLTISLLAYVATAIIVGANFKSLLLASIIPHFELTPAFAMMFVAIFGATLTPYAFFWQASQEAEEDVVKHKITEINRVGNSPKISKKEMMLMRSDVTIGMALSQLIMWAIITTTATTPNANNITDIQTADQAARALQPLVKTFPDAGEISKTIFALGVIGTGLLAIPVTAGASGYALSDAFGWKEGLNKSFTQARNFYLVIAVSTVIGLLINFTNLDPIRALVYSANMTNIKQCDKCGSTSNKGQWYYAYLKIKSRYVMCKQCFFKYLAAKDDAGHGTPFDWDKSDKAGEAFLTE
jgi:Mn2+/Fe2+ NRAMP family transporter